MAFEKGNKHAPGGRRAGAGRKPKEAKDLLKKLLDGITLQDWEELRNVALSRAKAGDFPYFKMLMEYQFGKPVEKKEQSGPDGGPIQVAVANVPSSDELKQLPADELLRLHRETLGIPEAG